MSSSVRSTRNSEKAEFKSFKARGVRYAKIRGISLAILQILLKHKTLTAREIAELLHVNINVIRVYMWRLKRYGLVTISGTYNYYYYTLTEKAYELLTKLKYRNNGFEYHEPVNMFFTDL